MKLISIQIIGVGATAWSSNKLYFGDRVTQLFGANGCGKTPLVQSIVFALGSKIEFRDDILDRCDYVVLEVSSRDQTFLLKRNLKSTFSVTVSKHDGVSLDFESEREYSRFLLELCGTEERIVTTMRDDATPIYFPQVLPLFYLDQDHGYSTPYYIAQKYIKDQYCEVTRLAFGLVSKNPFDKRRERYELRDKLDYLDRAVVRSERITEELAADLGGQRRPIDEIDEELKDAIKRLEALRNSDNVARQVGTELDARVAVLGQREQRLIHERSELNARARGLKQIRHEIEVEANTLSLNEEARRVFASFDAICSNEGCGLFLRSSQNYGKSLLYLKDQVKDLERIGASLDRRVDEIASELSLISSEMSRAIAARKEAEEQSPVSALVNAVEDLTARVIQLRSAKKLEEELTREEIAYVGKLEDRAQVQKRLGDLEGNSTAANLDLIRVRNALAERIKHWLDVLGSVNVERDVQVSSDFAVTFGGQKVEKFKGSTLTRIILAIRTACFDVLAQNKAQAFRFFVLDTPRQQDIKREDLAQYIVHLQALASATSTQIVFSTTNHRYQLGVGDKEWVPEYLGEKQLMFLGVEEPTDGN